MNQSTITRAIGIGGAVVGLGAGIAFAVKVPEPDNDTVRKVGVPILGAGIGGLGIVLASDTAMRIPMGVQCAGFAVGGLVSGLFFGTILGATYLESL